jgi:hypothetical protein
MQYRSEAPEYETVMQAVGSEALRKKCLEQYVVLVILRAVV